MKRLISANYKDIKDFDRFDLLQSIKASEGRVILSENIVEAMPLLLDTTNSELAKANGADMILLNLYDLNKNFIFGLPKTDNPIALLKKLVGVPVGINLEPVDYEENLIEDRLDINDGRKATINNFKKANMLGVDYICLTGNPQVGVTNKSILASIKEARKHYNGVIIAGKMHASGSTESILDLNVIKEYILAGADIILLPSLNTVPGISEEELKTAVKLIHDNNCLALGAIGTSQEGSDVNTIREIALSNKRIGFDISHIGDCGYFGVALPENIMAMSIAVKGRRHTYFRMANSINR